MTFYKFLSLLLLLCIAMPPLGCGQKGDLYLPDAETDQAQADERSSSKR